MNGLKSLCHHWQPIIPLEVDAKTSSLFSANKCNYLYPLRQSRGARTPHRDFTKSLFLQLIVGQPKDFRLEFFVSLFLNLTKLCNYSIIVILVDNNGYNKIK